MPDLAHLLHHLAERVHLRIDPLQVQVLSSRSSPAAPLPTGWFTAGQEASIVLSSQGFDRAGGPLDFLFPGSPALPSAWTPEESPTP